MYRVDPDTQPKAQAKAISEAFEDARENQPSLILMDNLDRFLDKADALVNKLRTELAKLGGSQVVVAAAARSIYDIDTSLRSPSAFKTKLELFPPNAKQREDILRQILGTTSRLGDLDFTALAERTHGFVGRDIHDLCLLARDQREQQIDESISEEEKTTFGEKLEQTDYVRQEDFDAVFGEVQPTVLKDSILEVPKVRWTDIAGLDHVRAVLEAFINICNLFTILTIFLVSRPRHQIWWTSVSQRCPALRSTWLRKDFDRASCRNREQTKLSCSKRLRTHQDVCWRI